MSIDVPSRGMPPKTLYETYQIPSGQMTILFPPDISEADLELMKMFLEGFVMRQRVLMEYRDRLMES